MINTAKTNNSSLILKSEEVAIRSPLCLGTDYSSPTKFLYITTLYSYSSCLSIQYGDLPYFSSNSVFI